MFIKQFVPVESKYHDEVVAQLQKVIDTEHSAIKCYQRLGALIKNGRIRKQFYLSADTAQSNESDLLKYLSRLGIKDFILEETCTFCKINLESFSLEGAVDLGLQISDNAIKSYRELLRIVSDSKDKIWLKRQMKEKIRQRDLLKKEKTFDHELKEPDLISTFCRPLLTSKFGG